MEEGIQILLVEDNSGDVPSPRGICEVQSKNQLHITKDGEEATEFLYQRSTYADAPARPSS